ncbi:MAG TPA: PQQ-binding-like beta-propeller repeat protein [Candidatus Acidoferrum sp.]|nr:PQQ-binding-like beta-propeller repeat protein [Candidatus Acidoferrum sp.]
MEVKVQCGCGTRFAFEVEPVNGRMPVRVKCPECGADGTDFANELIRQKLGAAAPVIAPVAIAPGPFAVPPVAAQPPPTPAPQPMRVAVPPATAAPVAAEVSITYCPRHLKNPAVDACRVCGKPICEDCMQTYGYVCSTFCRKRAEETGIELPVYARQRAVIEARMARAGRLIWRTAIVVVVALLGTWIWYTFWGSRPKVVYSETLPHGDRARFYKLLSSSQVLSVKANQMSLFDLAQQKRLWSVPLNVGFSPPPPPDTSVPNVEEDVELYPPPRVIATTNDLWMLFPGRLIQYDRRSGNSKQEIPLNPPFFGLAETDGSIIAISSDELDHEVVTRIRLADGTVQTEILDPAAAAPAAKGSRSKASGSPPSTNSASIAAVAHGPAAPPLEHARSPAVTPTTTAKILAAVTNAVPALAKPVVRENMGDKFMADGAGVVQMKVGLIERKTIAHQAMKQPKKSLIDNNLTAGQSMDAVEREMNEMRREQTGGVEEEDVSRYQVTLRRLPAGSAPDWTGEAIGPPSFYPLKTLGVLVSGKIIQVFDKSNRRLWGANLTYPVASRYSLDFATESDPPCVEAGGALYVFDQGMLTKFDAATGEVNWRLTSVGISQVQLDEKKNLYVTSTTASPDSIQFSQQVDFSAKGAPVILKVDAATGKILWRNEGLGNTCFVTGKYVYISRATENPLTGMGDEPILYFDLYRLSPSDGHALWDYSQSRLPVQIEAEGNQILIHFRGELQVLKFFSL